MGREIERKFLVRNESWREAAAPGVPYRQGYLSLAPEATTRIRIAGEKGFLTIKGRAQGAARDEFEYEIPVADAGQLLERICARPQIEKTRYDVQHGGLKWVVDVFGGENRGLVMAEAELEDESQQILIPEWAGKEVTGDERYSNRALAANPYRNWGVNGLQSE